MHSYNLINLFQLQLFRQLWNSTFLTLDNDVWYIEMLSNIWSLFFLVKCFNMFFNFFQAELIVHKKKVAEVRSWLLDHLAFKKVRR